jgi:predicted Zn-dependent protease
MWAAGYDPGAMATMFEKLEAKNKEETGDNCQAVRGSSAPADRRGVSGRSSGALS